MKILSWVQDVKSIRLKYSLEKKIKNRVEFEVRYVRSFHSHEAIVVKWRTLTLIYQERELRMNRKEIL